MAPVSQAPLAGSSPAPAVAPPLPVPAHLQNAANDTLTPEDENEMTDQALYVSISVVQQALSMLEASKLKDEQLSHPSKMIPGGSIGKHLRHATDHWKLLLKVRVSESMLAEVCANH